jgi:hypothetical protein
MNKDLERVQVLQSSLDFNASIDESICLKKHVQQIFNIIHFKMAQYAWTIWGSLANSLFCFN